MPTQIFFNIAVKDLNKSMEFYKKLGYTFNPQFTDETAASMVISDTIYAMLLTHDKFKQFTTREIADNTKVTEVMLALSCDSIEAVHKMADTAIANGGKEHRPPQDYGFMFGRSFEDLDGHIWEPFYMNPDFVQK